MIADESAIYHNWYSSDVVSVRPKAMDGGGTLCPTCCTPFDKGKHRKLIDTCGHEICYMCINSDHCPLCVYHAQQQRNEVSIPRPRLKTNGHFTTFMQGRGTASPERPLNANLPPKAKPAVPVRTVSINSPRISRPTKNYRHTKWPNVISAESPCALSDDEVHTNSKIARDQDLYTRLGLLLGERTPFSTSQSHGGSKGFQDSYASISSLTSSDANTNNTSPLSTLTISDSSEVDPLSGSLRTNSRDPSSDSVVSLMSTSTGHSSCSSPGAMHFQRHIPARTSDSFVQFAKHNLNRKQVHYNSDESALYFTALGRKSCTTKLLNKILKPLYFEVPSTESEPLFIGRQWLFKEIEQELNCESKGRRAIVISGGPGSGKTAIVSQLVDYSSFRVKKEDAIYHDIQSLDGSDYTMSNSSSSDSGLYQSISTLPHSGAALRFLACRLVAYHLCQADNHLTCMVPEFVHNVAAQLCRAPQLTAYRDLVARDQRLQELLGMPSCIADPCTAFTQGILQPLNLLRSRNKIPNTTCLLVVDALNEAQYHRPEYGDSIVSFLIRHFEALPAWFKVIVTIRSSYSELVKKLPSYTISLDKVSANENIQKDLCTYILHRINTTSAIRANITVNNSKVEGCCTSKFASHLANLSKGCILYVRLTLDLIERGHLVVKSSSYRVLPVCLSEVYTLSFNLRFTTIKAYERVTPLLQICLATLSPLTLQELFHTLNARCVSEGVTWDDFMGRMDVLSHFVVARQDGTVMFVHPSMREWLLRREENESTKFLCDVRPGHASIAFRMSRNTECKSADSCIELGHHILKAHLYKSSTKDQVTSPLPRDIQAFWLNLGSNSIQTTLGSWRNLYSPNCKVSRLLLLAGADPNHLIEDMDHMPILAIFARQGYTEMVSLLLEFNANVHAVSRSGVGPLALACQKGYLDIVRLLVAAGAKINQKDYDGKCPALHAAANGHLEILMHLFQCKWNQGDAPTIYQVAQRSLIVAASNGHHSICEYLLDMSEVQVNAVDSLTGQTALTAASMSGHVQTCNVLLRRGASVNAANRQRETPVLCAASNGHWEAVEKLLLHGAALEHADASGRTPLMTAAMGGHPVLELLLSKGASPDVTDNEGLTALSWACLKGHYQAVQCLLGHGSDVNCADNSGRTSLDFAAFNGDPEIVQLLLDSGAKMEHADKGGVRPLDRAIGCRNTAAVARFLHNGAKLGSQIWIMAQGNPDILFLLLSKLLEDATVLCKRSRLKDGAHRYQYALKKFPAENITGLDQRFSQIKYQLLLGLSRCRRKLDDPKLAVDAAEQAIALRPTSFEGYYARARAREDLGLHEEALSDILEALRVAPQHQEMKRMLTRLKEQVTRQPYCDNHLSDIGFSGLPMTPSSESFGSTETMDQLCNLTLNLVEDLNQLHKDRMQDSGCESIH